MGKRIPKEPKYEQVKRDAILGFFKGKTPEPFLKTLIAAKVVIRKEKGKEKENQLQIYVDRFFETKSRNEKLKVIREGLKKASQMLEEDTDDEDQPSNSNQTIQKSEKAT